MRHWRPRAPSGRKGVTSDRRTPAIDYRPEGPSDMGDEGSVLGRAVVESQEEHWQAMGNRSSGFFPHLFPTCSRHLYHSMPTYFNSRPCFRSTTAGLASRLSPNCHRSGLGTKQGCPYLRCSLTLALSPFRCFIREDCKPPMMWRRPIRQSRWIKRRSEDLT